MEYVDIVNIALDHLGQTNITALSDENKVARIANRRINFIRKSVMREHPWNFAINRATLEYSDANQAGYEYQYSYNVASDCLRILEFYPKKEYGYDFKLEKSGEAVSAGVTIEPLPFGDYEFGNTGTEVYMCLITNAASPARIKYIGNVQNPNEFDPLFVEALAARIAAELALPLTNDKDIMAAMWQIYQGKITEAELQNAIEGNDPDEDDPGSTAGEGSWISCR